MQNTTTTNPHFLTALAFVLLVTYSIIALSFTLEPQAYQQSDGVSWANNSGSKVPLMDTGNGATAVHELIVAVPWAVNGSKIPAFGFVR